MGCTLLVLLVILLHDFSTTVATSNKSDDFPTRQWLTCRRCKFYSIKVGEAVAPVVGATALPDEKSSGKKTNVGAVVGLTFLLVFVIGVVVVCIYRNRGSPSSPRIGTQQPVVVQPTQAQELVQRPARHEQKGVVGKVEPKEGVRAKKVVGKDGDVDKVARPKRPNVGVGQGHGVEERGDDRKKKVVAGEVIEPKGDGRDVKGREEVVGKANDNDVKVARPRRPNVGQGHEERMDEKKKGVVEDVIEPKRHQEKRGDMERQRQKQKQVQVEKVVGKDVVNDNVARLKRPNVGEGKGNEEHRDEEKKKKKEVAGEVMIEPEQKEVRHQRKRDGRERHRRVQLEKKEEEDDNVLRSNKRSREGKQPLQDEDRLENEYKRGREVPKKFREGKKPQEEVVLERENSLELPNKFNYRYLMSVTNNFDLKNIVGGGGFGTVYRGTLVDGTVVAVKCLRYGGRIDDFRNEVDALGKADHSNLVKLIGYCNEGITRILVYEYMRNGSLDNWIFNFDHKKSLTWPEMKNIVQGIAEGLEYLHEKCEKKILHRDLKPANVLLDDNKNAKLCDFGIAKLLNKDQSSTSTAWAGTKGYMAPEVKKGRISDKVDVYSFGVVALEVMFGKPCDSLVSSDQINNVKDFNFHDLIKDLSEDMRRNGKEIAMFGKLAMFCLREKPEKRPTMSNVVAAINGLETRFKVGKARRN
ncbi:hypothetical protein vseg_018876 [Gypsophila vaccaria]